VKKKDFSRLNFLAPVLVFIVIFISWETIVNVFHIPRQVLPSPVNIFKSLFDNFIPLLSSHFLITLRTILTGFVIAVPTGILLGAVLSQYKILEKAISPYVIILVTTPLIVLVPLFMLWLGFGTNVRILAVIAQAIPVIMLNSITGFNSVEKTKLELMESLGATKWQTFVKVTFPNALSHVFTGITLGGVFSTISVISAEIVGGKTGLGNRIIYFSGFIETELAFACILLVILIGVTLATSIGVVRDTVIKWKN
jgi:NitT/TauT family transport system permease protein